MANKSVNRSELIVVWAKRNDEKSPKNHEMLGESKIVNTFGRL